VVENQRRRLRQALLDSEVAYTAAAAAWGGKEGAGLLNEFREQLRRAEK